MKHAFNPKRSNFVNSIALSLLVAASQMGLAGAATAAGPTQVKSQVVSTSHVDAYFKALSKKDKEGIAQHFAGNIVLLGPIFPEPTNGKEAVAQALWGFLDTIDTLKVDSTFASGRDIAVFFRFSVNGITVKGNEHLHVNEKGLIDSIEVAWRPLPDAVAAQELIAKKAGFEPLRLERQKERIAPAEK